MAKRFWELDYLRGLGITGVVIFHFLFDLTYYNYLDLNLSSGFWRVFTQAGASLFLILVGISLTISYNGSVANLTEKKMFLKYLKRGIYVFSWGLVITMITWIFLRQGTVVFGILHLIGLAIILAYPLLKFSYPNLILGLILILAGSYFNGLSINSPWFFWLGLTTTNFYTVDYFPLLPWFGVVLIGVAFGNLFYSAGARKYYLPDLSNYHLVKFFGLLGQHSLLIYLLHQPIIIAVLYSLNYITTKPTF